MSYEHIQKIANQIRKADPTLSEAQAFARAYVHPGNRDLAEAERAAHRPVAKVTTLRDAERALEPVEKRMGYGTIEAAAEAIRKRHPEMSTAQAFARAMADPANREAAAAALGKAASGAPYATVDPPDPPRQVSGTPMPPAVASIDEMARAVQEMTGCTPEVALATVQNGRRLAADTPRQNYLPTGEAAARFLQGHQVPDKASRTAPLPDATQTATAAYMKIERLAAELRAADPGLSAAQAFSKAYQDRANVALAAAERSGNRPG